MHGKWELHEAYINDSETNALDYLLPYTASDSTCCNYYIYFEKNGMVRTEFYSYDTLNYSTEGNWVLMEYNRMYIKCDEYIDGVYDVEKVDKKKFKLRAINNTVSFLKGMVVSLDLYATKEKI